MHCADLVLLVFPLLAEARSLILWMLSYRPEDRPTIENILSHPWLKMSSSSSSGGSSTSLSSVKSPPTTATPNYQSPSASTTSSHYLHAHHHNHHYYSHHKAPMPSPQLHRLVAPKPVKNAPVSPYLTRAAIAMASYTSPVHSRSQGSLSSSSASSSPRSPASLNSASRASLGTSPSNSQGSCISLVSMSSAASLSGGHHHAGGSSLDASTPKVPVGNSRRSRFHAVGRRK